MKYRLQTEVEGEWIPLRYTYNTEEEARDGLYALEQATLSHCRIVDKRGEEVDLSWWREMHEMSRS